jgi:hypothetical protein
MFGQEGSIGTTAKLDLIVERDASAKGGFATAKGYGMKGKGDMGMGNWAGNPGMGNPGMGNPGMGNPGMGLASGGKGDWKGGWGKGPVQAFGKANSGKAWGGKPGKDASVRPQPAAGNNGVNLQDLLRQSQAGRPGNPAYVPGGPATGEASESKEEAAEEGEDASGVTEQREEKRPDPLEALFTPKASPTNTESMDALFASTPKSGTSGDKVGSPPGLSKPEEPPGLSKPEEPYQPVDREAD